MSTADDMTALTIPTETLVVQEGAEAWGRIKERARMDREDWKLVGEALLVGRRQHKSNQAFGQWCRENGFGDIPRATRADAMWLAENWDEVMTVVPSRYIDTAHPKNIREAYREATKGRANDALPFTEADAEHAHKLNAMATRGGTENEREVGRAKLENFASQFGKTADEVVQQAEKVKPEDALTEAERRRREAEEMAEKAKAELARRERVLAEMKARFASASKEELIEILADLKARGRNADKMSKAELVKLITDLLHALGD